MDTLDFNLFLTKEEQRELAEEANQMATHLVFEDPDQLSTAVKLCFDNLRYQKIISHLTENGVPLPANTAEEPEETELTEPVPEEDEAENAALAEAFRFATSAEALNAHPDAVFATLQMDFTGTVQMRSTNSAERALIVIIDGKAYPNPLYFTTLKNGTKSIELERLKPVFHIEGVGSAGSTYYLEKVIPAEADTANLRSLRLLEKGTLDFTSV